MNSTIQTDKMQSTGLVLSSLAGSSVVGMLIFFAAFLRSNSTSGTQGNEVLTHFSNGIGLALAFLILGAEMVALVLLGKGIVSWPSRVIRSPLWVLSAIGIACVAMAILAVAFLAATIAVQNP